MTPLADPVIAVDDARMRFGEVRALDGVSIAVRPGECIGLVGHNGAGKSTIVNVINGGLTPQSGAISIAGKAVQTYSIDAARQAGIRCVFQELSLCPNLTVTENARITHRDLRGLGWRGAARRIVSAALDRIFPGHGISMDASVGDLSIAERQMTEIAMAFSDAGTAPRLVILDEPTSSLDSGSCGTVDAPCARFRGAGRRGGPDLAHSR